MNFTISSIFDRDGILATKFSDYEFRPQQVKMAAVVENALFNRHHLLVEAGTGVGKSLAYLIPLIRWSLLERKRVVVATYTKTLQHQLVSKDIPLVQSALGINFKYALCVGNRNYICLRRLESVLTKGDLFEDKLSSQLKKVYQWLAENVNTTGLRSDFDFAISDTLWDSICREVDLCLGKKCGYKSNCYYFKAKRERFSAQLLVVNHHLFFANLTNKERILPNYEAVVFDEAHMLEEVATNFLGIEIANTGVAYLLNSIYNPKTGRGCISYLPALPAKLKQEIADAIREAQFVSDIFFKKLITKFESEITMTQAESVKYRLTVFDELPAISIIAEPFNKLISLLKTVARENASDEDTRIELEALQTRLISVLSGLDVFLNQRLSDYVYWVEVSRAGRSLRVSCFSAPTDVSATLKETLFERIPSVILTSATLATNNSFSFIKQRLGITDDTNQVAELILGSPFDFENQVLLYINKDGTDPSVDEQTFVSEVAEKTKELIQISKGRAFVLFTSYWMMDEVYNKLVDKLADLQLQLLKQGDAPREKLLEKFRKNIHSVLFGTLTFWQGIDVPGEALSCVIITRLPFDVPDEPIIQARLEKIKEQGLNPFYSYSVPQAIIIFKQGFGRLIRTKDDTGVVAILDSRVIKKPYGKLFLNSLPSCRITTEITDVIKFFKQKKLS